MFWLLLSRFTHERMTSAEADAEFWEKGAQNFFLRIYASIWHINEEIFMLLSFLVFFESEFLRLTHLFLSCTLRFSLKIIINLLGDLHVSYLCFVTVQKVTRVNNEKGGCTSVAPPPKSTLALVWPGSKRTGIGFSPCPTGNHKLAILLFWRSWWPF